MASHIEGDARLVRGMHAPVSLRFTDVPCVDFAAAASLSLTMTVVGPGISFTVQPSAWTWSGKSGGNALATWRPNGTEFTSNGWCRFSLTLIVDGAPVDLLSFHEWVDDN